MAFDPPADEDEQFKEEKAVLIREISVLGAAPPPSQQSAAEPEPKQ